MHIIGIIIIGFLAGVVAKLLMPGRDPGGFIVTTLLGGQYAGNRPGRCDLHTAGSLCAAFGVEVECLRNTKDEYANYVEHIQVMIARRHPRSLL